MAKMNFLKICFMTGTALLVLSCSHVTVKEEVRIPASNHSHASLNADQISQVEDIVRRQDSQQLRSWFLGIRINQILVTSFDARLTAATEARHVESLLQSNLYCKLLKIRNIHELLEDKIKMALQLAYSSGSPVKNWFYEQLMNFAKENVASEVAAVQLIRSLVNEEKNICASSDCVMSDIKTLQGFHFDPMDNKAFNKFTTKNRSSIALYSESKENDLKPGKCFGENRGPNQAAPYDWKNRNWSGASLPDGHFIFTYDDGPHPVFTKIIINTWAQAGMVKPTFFWLQKNILFMSDLVKDISAQGYVIGSHSDRHSDLGSLANAQTAEDLNEVDKDTFGDELKGVPKHQFQAWKNHVLDREINQAVASLSALTAKPVTYFRLPYGSGLRNDLIGARFQALDLDHFYWRVDSLDWQDRNPESIRDRTVLQMTQVKKGIVLFHDVHPQSVEAAKLMVEVFKQNPQWKAVPLDSLPKLRKK